MKKPQKIWLCVADDEIICCDIPTPDDLSGYVRTDFIPLDAIRAARDELYMRGLEHMLRVEDPKRTTQPLESELSILKDVMDYVAAIDAWLKEVEKC